MAFGSSKFAGAMFGDAERVGTPVVTVPGFSAGATATTGAAAGGDTATAASGGEDTASASSAGSTRIG